MVGGGSALWHWDLSLRLPAIDLCLMSVWSVFDECWMNNGVSIRTVCAVQSSVGVDHMDFDLYTDGWTPSRCHGKGGGGGGKRHACIYTKNKLTVSVPAHTEAFMQAGSRETCDCSKCQAWGRYGSEAVAAMGYGMVLQCVLFDRVPSPLSHRLL